MICHSHMAWLHGIDLWQCHTVWPYTRSATPKDETPKTKAPRKLKLREDKRRKPVFLSVSLKKIVFGPGTLPQAPFLSRKLRFWCWYVAAGAFFGWKIVCLVLERCRRRFFLWKIAFLVPERCRRRFFWWKIVCFGEDERRRLPSES